jgi:hypothetical protein
VLDSPTLSPQRTNREARLQLAGMLLIAAAGTAAIGEFNTTIGILSLIFAVIWVSASAVYGRRG